MKSERVNIAVAPDVSYITSLWEFGRRENDEAFPSENKSLKKWIQKTVRIRVRWNCESGAELLIYNPSECASEWRHKGEILQWPNLTIQGSLPNTDLEDTLFSFFFLQKCYITFECFVLILQNNHFFHLTLSENPVMVWISQEKTVSAVWMCMNGHIAKKGLHKRMHELLQWIIVGKHISKSIQPP